MDQGGSHTALRLNALHTGKGPITHGLAYRQQEAFIQLFKPFFFNEKEKEDLLWKVSGYFMSKPVAKIWNENFHQ